MRRPPVCPTAKEAATIMTTLTQCAFSVMLLLVLLVSVWSHQQSRA